MNLREMFLRTMRREISGYVPKNISLCPAQKERFKKEYGHTDISKQWNLPVQSFPLGFSANCSDFSRWLGQVGKQVMVDEWGVGHEPVSGAFHFSRLIHPLLNVQRVGKISEYPFPSLPGKKALSLAQRESASARQRGVVTSMASTPLGGTIFWPAYKLRGMENLLCDMHLAPELARALLDKICSLVAQHARLAAATGVDILTLADDLGTQQSTYLSPTDFRCWLKPRLAEVIAAAKEVKPDILVYFHSDGAIQDFIPDLIEIGVDILNPVQPECMDPLEIKKKYGDVLSFCGCLGTQTTMPFGTAEEVRAKVRLYCENVGKGGGFWIAPTHVIEPEVPWENILAFIETADEYAQFS